MSHERLTSLRSASAAPPPDLVTELVVVLAGVLRLKPEKIDPEQTFRSLGLDSLLTVEFVATVNARFGTAVRAAALLDHPTPLAFARYVAGEPAHRRPTPMTPTPPAATVPAAPVPAVPAAVAPAPAPAPVPASAPVAPVAGAAAREVLDVLREELARILCCDPWDIDTTAAFNLLGVDSILGAQFVAVINQTYGIDERAVTLYDHPNLTAMAAHIALLTQAAPPAPAAPEPAPAPAPERAHLTLEALLDAVRDERLSVDEALTLLPRRA
ncbi:acyl carrier protein [Streptomyces sp. WAC05374]|uniref:acyl carrier protein n=1 Tax=Streptomyces sp. WAC05374 TaxID=2487420 RepID=UPI000F889698|nr:acyl carrier protein [Streptomyces sp. WAC05374]RST18398.1 acyl carrier protein [Streptomyces sp. WAC05374]TDF36185.1 acyl carrier protein [Streptomyces sp. WAC05374]TDF45703.1 acyl carrier protein [Streptomyces sp. WAC05374]TDF46668.1 acyl carrier protein [Streptomyces sp. WAC05374]